MFRDGHGVTADLERATKLLDLACQGGAPFACTNAGDLDVTRADLPASVKHYKQGCDAADAVACRKMGIAYLEGKGLPVSTTAATVWLDRSCKADDPIACRVLGAMRVQGIGAPQDVALGRTLLARACDRKDAEACKALAALPAGAGSGTAGSAAGSGSAQNPGSGSGLP